MNPPNAVTQDPPTIHWPEPAHLRLDAHDGAAERCEIHFNDGTTEVGDLLRFTGRDDHLVFRPHPGHPRYPASVYVRTNRFKRLRLLDPVGVRPVDVAIFSVTDEAAAVAQLHVYNVEFTDQEIESGDTNGYVRNAAGLFLFFASTDDRVERVFVPQEAIAYFQAGEPIGRLLVEENAVSEEQLAAAVEKQQEMRKLVLGDYLIEEGLIDPAQLDAALELQRERPSLRLGEALIELGAVAAEALQIALARQRANRGRPLGQILVDMGVVDADTLNKIHAKKLGSHFVSLTNFTASPEAIRTIPPDAARRLGVMPLSIEHGDLIVAAESQLDSSAINELTLLSRMRVVQVLASGQDIKARRAEAYGDAGEDSLLSDASALRFGTPDLVGDYLPEVEALEGEAVYREQTAGSTDPHLIEAIERALEAVEAGGTLEIRVESRPGLRTTRIRLSR